MPVSIREVAARAGVARGTVSSVLNDRGSEIRISAQTQERIRRVAEEMGYRPNRLAQGLGKGRTNIIGLMIAGLRNPFFLGLMEAAEERAFEAGYEVLTDSAFQLRASYAANGRLSGWPVDGILIWVDPDQTLSDYLGVQHGALPVVYLGYRRDDASDFVAIDRENGARQLMQHLRERGYQRIAYLYPGPTPLPQDPRYAAYADLCRQVGQDPEPISLEPINSVASVTQAWMREAGLEAGLRLAARPAAERPDAVICLNDLVAIGLYHGLRRAGLRVPEDIAVAGFDGIDEGQFLDKPLTTVASPGSAMIENALRILTRRLQESVSTPVEPQQVVLPSVLQVGGTT